MLLRSLHQRADDVLLGRYPAEEVPPGFFRRLVVEYWRVARMRHEIGDVLAVRHLARIRRGGVEDDERRSWPDLADDAVRDLTDQPVRHGENDNVRARQRLILLDAVGAHCGAQALPPFLRNLDMEDVERRTLQVSREPHAHLAASAEQREFRHSFASPLCPENLGAVVRYFLFRRRAGSRGGDHATLLCRSQRKSPADAARSAPAW